MNVFTMSNTGNKYLPAQVEAMNDQYRRRALKGALRIYGIKGLRQTILAKFVPAADLGVSYAEDRTYRAQMRRTCRAA